MNWTAREYITLPDAVWWMLQDASCEVVAATIVAEAAENDDVLDLVDVLGVVREIAKE
jgi:hypothetical protein